MIAVLFQSERRMHMQPALSHPTLRRFFPKLFNFLFLAVFLVSLASPTPALAATYRNWIAQQASQPTPGQVVRVWMNSDTALGETAGLEYHVVSTYTKVLGTFDTSYPGANWRADIPASVQTLGTHVEYQLFTRNQSGQDYGFTGFNWSYDVTDIHWNGLLHDTFNSSYRSPFGAQPEDASVLLKL